MNSGFPEFDQAFKNALLPENPDQLDLLAAEANFGIYHNDLWRGVARRFGELIVRKCAEIALREDHDPYECILKHFGIVDIKPAMRYTAILEEDPDTGDLMMPLPEDLLKDLGWDIGDTLTWNVDEATGRITLTKKND